MPTKQNPFETVLRFRAHKDLKKRLEAIVKASGKKEKSDLMREGVELHVTAEEIRLGIRIPQKNFLPPGKPKRRKQT